MKKTLRLLILYWVAVILLSLPSAAFAQSGLGGGLFGGATRRVLSAGTLPAACNFYTDSYVDLIYKSGASPGIYACSATNTWTLQAGISQATADTLYWRLAAANTGTGNATISKSSATINIAGTLNSGTASMNISNGTGTLSNRQAWITFTSSETVQQQWLIGLVASKAFTLRNNTTATNFFSADETTSVVTFPVAGTVLTTPVENGVRQSVVATTTTATILSTEAVFTADATGGAYTVTLTDCTASTIGQTHRGKKIDASANVVTVSGGASDTIDGAATTTLATQYESKDFVCTAADVWSIF